MWGTKVYLAWGDMKSRCTNQNTKAYKHYGGRGITVCEEWLNFKAYYEYVSNLPNYGVKGYTLDRIDNDGDYEPENVKYSTRSEQSSNKRGYGTSKFKGVSWHKPLEKWLAKTWINGKSKYIGYFNTELEASEAYQNKLRELNQKSV